MRMDSETQDPSDAQTNCLSERTQLQTTEGNSKVQFQALQVDFENMEESLRNMLRHNGQASGNGKDDPTRQMHAYKNAISKFRNHINIVERENHALKRQISGFSSQTSPTIAANTDVTVAADGATTRVNTENTGKSQLEDIRTTCLMLSDRIKRMEEQNTQLLVNSEKQRFDYERCLDRVASQVIQALACQRRLQLECDALRMQVHYLTGNRAFINGQSPQSISSGASGDSPNGPLSGGSISDDAFSPTSPTSPLTSYAPWPHGAQNPTAGTHGDSSHLMYCPTHTGGAANAANPKEKGFPCNPRMQMLERMFQSNGTTSFNGYPPNLLNLNDIANFNLQLNEFQYERQQMPGQPNSRIQSNKIPPLHVIHESIEPGMGTKTSAGFRPRLLRCESEILRGATSVGDMTSPRRAMDDEVVECTSRSRGRQRGPTDRHKVVRSRSFDNHSYGRDEMGRPRQAMSPRRIDIPASHNYRPGPTLNTVPNGAVLNRDVPKLRQPQEKGFMVISNQENVPPLEGHVQSPDAMIINPQSMTTSPMIARRPMPEQPPAQGGGFREEAQKPTSRPPAGAFCRQSRDKIQANMESHRRSRSQDARNNAAHDISPGSSFSRNMFQRSFRVTRSHERLRPGQISDDVWLPRSGRSPDDQIPNRPLGGSAGSGRRKFSRGASDLPPPPPPPPHEEEVASSLQQQVETTVEHHEADPIGPPETTAAPAQLSWRRKDVKNKSETHDAKKQALKRESYTAACRKSQSLDHLYQTAGSPENNEDDAPKNKELDEAENQQKQTGCSTYELHSRGSDSVTQQTTDAKPSDQTCDTPGSKGSLSKRFRGSCESEKAEPMKQVTSSDTIGMEDPSPRNGRKFLTPPKSASQLLPPSKSRGQKSSKAKPAEVIPQSRRCVMDESETPVMPTNQSESERYFRLDEDNTARQRLTSASSCEALSAQTSSQSSSHRRMSEGMARGLNGRSKIAAPSHKRLYSGRNQQQGSKSVASREPKQSPGLTKMLVGQKQQKLAPTSESSVGNLGILETSSVGLLPGTRPNLSSASHNDLSAKTRSPPAPRRGVAASSGSHPNLSKSSPDPPVPSRQPQGRRIYETSLVSSAPGAGQAKKSFDQQSKTDNSNPDNTSSRSQSVEARINLSSGKEIKVPRRSLSSDRISKRAANLAKKQLLEQKLERKNDAVQRDNNAKKKGGHPKSFVDMMKSRFGSKSGSSQNKKSAEVQKSRCSDAGDGPDSAPQSVIDPRTLSLEPNSIPPPGYSGKKGSKKKSEMGISKADPVGRKLSQPFLKASPQALESLTEISPGVANNDTGKKSFLKRQNSKRNKGARLADLTRGDHFNNNPFGRVELIPVGSLASLNAMTNPGFAEAQHSIVRTDDINIPGGRGMGVDSELNDCDREVEAMTNRNLSGRTHNYENVIIRPEPLTQGENLQQAQTHSYENVILTNQAQKPLVDCAAESSEKSRSLDSRGRATSAERDDSPQRGKAKNAKSSAAPLRRIWESLSNHSLNKVGENSHSNSSLHQISGGRCISGEGNFGNKANNYSNEQKAFEKVFMSSVVEAELSQTPMEEEANINTDQTNPKQVPSDFQPITSVNVIDSHTSDVITPDYSQTESGKSSMTFSTTDSSKSGNSSFDSWPTKGGDVRSRLDERQGGSLDTCYRNMKPSETFGPYGDKLHSPRKVGSRSSLGSFGYGSGVSNNSTSSSNKSGSHRGRSSESGNRCDEKRDSSSDSDLTPSQTPQTNSIQRKYAARKSLSPTRSAAAQGTRLQKPTRLSRINGGVSPGRVRMGVSSISPESYRPDERIVTQPENGVRKLAPLSYSQPLSPLLPRTNISLPTKYTSAKQRDPRRSGLPCGTAANVPVASRLVPQHTSIPVRYSSQRQQQHAR